MPTRRLSIRKIKEVLRLRFELGLGQRAIARACSISQSTVHEYLKRAEAAKVPRPLPESWDQERVEKALFGERRFIEQYPERVRPDFRSSSHNFGGGDVRRCRLTTSRAIILRPCIARSGEDGSAMLMPKTRSGIRACCQSLMRAARSRLALVMKPFVIRCGTPDCDWGHKMHDMSEDQLQLCLTLPTNCRGSFQT